MDKLYWIVCEEGDKTVYEGRHQAKPAPEGPR